MEAAVGAGRQCCLRLFCSAFGGFFLLTPFRLSPLLFLPLHFPSRRLRPCHFWRFLNVMLMGLVRRLYPLTPGRFGRDGLLFFIHLETRRVSLVGFTPYPDQDWMEQQARNMTMEEWGCLRGCRYRLHDRDAKLCPPFRELIKTEGVNPLRLPARSPNLNSHAERWARSVKEECLSRLILVGESSLRRALQQYTVHYHEERNHQGKGNRILFPSQTEARRNMGAVRCRERLGGLLKYYERQAA